MSVEKELTGLGVGSNALEECESVADAVGDMRGEVGRDKEAVDGDDFLQQCRHDP